MIETALEAADGVAQAQALGVAAAAAAVGLLAGPLQEEVDALRRQLSAGKGYPPPAALPPKRKRDGAGGGLRERVMVRFSQGVFELSARTDIRKCLFQGGRVCACARVRVVILFGTMSGTSAARIAVPISCSY